MPRIDVTQKILDLKGNPIFGPPKAPGDDGEPIPPKPMTLRSASIQALLSADEHDSGQQKFEAFRLAQKLQEDDKPFLKAEEIAKIKKAAGKIFIPVVVGRVWDLIDPPKGTPETKEAAESEDAAAEKE